MSVVEVLKQHRAAGRFFEAASVKSFAREQGTGDAVVCMHGVPVSSFLYRKVLPELAQRGLRGIAFDLPGLGLADRPDDFDYTWSGLGRWTAEAMDALELDSFHLLVHDIGGPVGFEVAARMPDRVRSLTVLNCPTKVSSFKKPWVMRPFDVPVVGDLWLKGTVKPVARRLFRMQGIQDQAAVTNDELDAHNVLLRQTDGGAAFLKIMRCFETTAEKEALYTSVLRSDSYPVQVAWGENDPALKLATRGEEARAVAGLTSIHRLPGKHFLQEDNAPAIADLVATIAKPGVA